MNDYYRTLDISSSASPDEIKAAYRKLASKHHPDKGGDTATFQKIQEAYENLSNPSKRAEYDNPQPQGFHFTGGGIPPEFAEMFRHFGMGGGDMFGSRPHPPQRNRTLNIQTQITLEEAYFGKELVANLKLPSGKDHVINVKVPPGVANGTVLRLREIGDDSISNVPKGDIHLTIYVASHNKFERAGDDLLTMLHVSAFDAMLGVEIDVDTINGATLSVKVPAGTQSGTLLGAQGYGMPNMHNSGVKGRLLFKVEVNIPTLTDEQRVLIQQAKELK